MGAQHPRGTPISGGRSIAHQDAHLTGTSDGHPAPARVLILYSDIGDGHASAARALAAELSQDSPGTDVKLEDGFAHLGRFMRFLQRDVYRAQLGRAPWLYGLAYGLFSASRLARATGALVMCAAGSRPLLRLVKAESPDVVVCTDPRVSVVLGHLRTGKRLAVPVCATLTDLGGLKFWVHPGVDTFLAPHPSLLSPVDKMAGQGSARLVRPPVDPAFYKPLSKAEARDQLGLPPEAGVVLLTGGGWGAGDLAGALRAVLAVPGTLAVCVCGKNQELKTELDGLVASLDRAADRVRVLGYTDQMNALLAAADTLVHSTGGVTCLEASVRHCPVIIYGAPHGHARHSARAMVRLGEADWAHSQAELSRLLEKTCGQGRTSARASARASAWNPLLGPKAGGVILAARPRPHPWYDSVRWSLSAGKDSAAEAPVAEES